MHIDIARARRRQVRLRVGLGTMAARAHGRDDIVERHLHARRSQLRLASKRRCSGTPYFFSSLSPLSLSLPLSLSNYFI